MICSIFAEIVVFNFHPWYNFDYLLRANASVKFAQISSGDSLYLTFWFLMLLNLGHGKKFTNFDLVFSMGTRTMCQKELERQAVSLVLRQTQQFLTLHPAEEQLSANNDRKSNIEGPRKIEVLVSALQPFDN